MSGVGIDIKDFWRRPYPDAIDKQHRFDWRQLFTYSTENWPPNSRFNILRMFAR